MNWINENKFLAVLIAVVVVVSGLLGFLMMSARSSYVATSEQLETQSSELSRLQSLKPYPEQATLDEFRKEEEAFASQSHDLRAKLTGEETPMVEITPEQFQDNLRATVSEVEKLAAEAKVTLPDGFYLGFSDYQASPPRTEAAARLDWELKVVAFVVKTLISNKITSIDDKIFRQPVPGESGASPAPTPSGPQKPKGDGKMMVERFPFTIAFTTEQSRFRSLLNQLAKSEEQFLVIETLSVKNERPEGPPKSAESTGGTSDAVAALTAGTAGGGEKARFQFIVGTEKLFVVLRIAALDFAKPEEPKKPSKP